MTTLSWGATGASTASTLMTRDPLRVCGSELLWHLRRLTGYKGREPYGPFLSWVVYITTINARRKPCNDTDG